LSNNILTYYSANREAAEPQIKQLFEENRELAEAVAEKHKQQADIDDRIQKLKVEIDDLRTHNVCY
jgi:chromosome segregation ATPase